MDLFKRADERSLNFRFVGDRIVFNPATGTYSLSSDGLREGLTMEVDATDSLGSISHRFQLTLSAVRLVEETMPTLVEDPRLEGEAIIGSALEVVAGVWMASPPAEISLQWTRDGEEIAGETAPTYTLRPSDDGCLIACMVSAVNNLGRASATTESVTAVYPAPVAKVELPDVAATTDETPLLVEAYSAFEGDALTFSVSGGAAEMDPGTGILRIPTGNSRTETLTVTARNSGGSDSVSFTVSITERAFAALWTPVNLPVQPVWLDASAANSLNGSGTLSDWSDRISNQVIATQSTQSRRPGVVADALDGKAVITFDGVDDFLTLSGVPQVTGAFSCYLVARQRKAGAVGFVTRFDGQNGDWIIDAPGSAQSRFLVRQNGTNGLAQTSGTQDTTDFHIHGAVNLSTQIWNSYDGVQSAAAGVSRIASTTTSETRIGGRVDNSACYAVDVAEVIFVSDGLVNDNRQRLEGYLAHKWGLQSNLPISHPYRATPPTVDTPYTGETFTDITTAQANTILNAPSNIPIKDDFDAGFPTDLTWVPDLIKQDADGNVAFLIDQNQKLGGRTYVGGSLQFNPNTGIDASNFKGFRLARWRTKMRLAPPLPGCVQTMFTYQKGSQDWREFDFEFIGGTGRMDCTIHLKPIGLGKRIAQGIKCDVPKKAYDDFLWWEIVANADRTEWLFDGDVMARYIQGKGWDSSVQKFNPTINNVRFMSGESLLHPNDAGWHLAYQNQFNQYWCSDLYSEWLGAPAAINFPGPLPPHRVSNVDFYEFNPTSVQFQAADWTATSSYITIANIRPQGFIPTNIQYRSDSGAWINLNATAIGEYPVNITPGRGVQVRAVAASPSGDYTLFGLPSNTVAVSK